ncbi:MAG: GNAT family N-acetyltransferase [Planctomycetota bacterium]|jgi:ribosomal protein S18 acetylase RimI-like enzyme|nr:GNAT family N-acetyltransferase [Planctomycetota bacterium]
MIDNYRFREEPSERDPAEVERIVRASGKFRDDEAPVAVELVGERLAKGEGSGYRFWFADAADGSLAGYVCYGPTPCTLGSFDLYWIVVDKKRQGRGLGGVLMSRAEESVRGAGGRRIYVETSGKDDYEPTRAFYRGVGYEEAARLPDFYADGDDKVIFRKIM